MSNLNVPSVGPLLTSPHIRDECIMSNDIQAIVQFKRHEETKVMKFMEATVPYMFID